MSCILRCDFGACLMFCLLLPIISANGIMLGEFGNISKFPSRGCMSCILRCEFCACLVVCLLLPLISANGCMLGEFMNISKFPCRGLH